MVVRTIEMLLEYVCIIVSIHKIAKQKYRFNFFVLLLFLLEWSFLVILKDYGYIVIKKSFIYIGIFLYIRFVLAKPMIDSIKIMGLMTVVITSLQLLLQFVITFCFGKERYLGTVVNAAVLLLCLCWNEKNWKWISNILKRINGLIIIASIYVFVLVKTVYVSGIRGVIHIGDSVQFWFEILILSILFIFVCNEEQKNKQKAKELQMYKLYNQAFEDTITTIRIRQHEFENHINALKCMRYSMISQEELLLEQEKYCNDILKDNRIGKLLRLKLEPVLIGFLYAKITNAEEEKICIEYKIEAVDIGDSIKVYEMIELIGVLFDNAVEALEENENKKIIMKLVNDKNGYMLEISNISLVFPNSKLEKFCVRGYSTKGDKRGMGLTRVREIVEKNNANLIIQNEIYGGENYLCFRVYWK